MSHFPYNDILNLRYPNPEIEHDFPNPILREAQFAPFSALNGHEEAVAEVCRLTSPKIVMDEAHRDEINQKLHFLKEHLALTPIISITHFVKDAKKEGGAYQTKKLPLKKISESENAVVLFDGTKIFMQDIYDLQSEIFPKTE